MKFRAGISGSQWAGDIWEEDMDPEEAARFLEGKNPSFLDWPILTFIVREGYPMDEEELKDYGLTGDNPEFDGESPGGFFPIEVNGTWYLAREVYWDLEEDQASAIGDLLKE